MRRQLKNKVFSTLLCVAVSLSMAACGSGTDQTVADAEPAAESTQEMAENTQEGGSESSEEPQKREETVTITVEVFDRGEYPEELGTITDNKWTRMMQEKVLEELNIDLQFMAIPRSDEVTKIQALMAADSEPDIFYTYDQAQMIQWAAAEALADLTPYMEAGGGKELSDYMGEDAMRYGQIEGVQYAVNAPRFDLGQYCCFIRKDMLDAVGVELGELNGHYAMTPSELKDAMIKIKEAGLCDYPIAIRNHHDSRACIEGAFLTDSSEESWAQARFDGYFTIDKEGDKEGFRFLNSCYNEGLINPDFALYDFNNVAEMVASGQTAFWSDDYWLFPDYLNALYEAEPDAEVVAMELTHEDGTPAIYERYSPIGAFGMVSSSCEDVEAAVDVLNWLITSEDAHLITHHGVEGENFEYQDGKIVVIETDDPNWQSQRGGGDLNVMLNNDPCSADLEYAEQTLRDKYAIKYPEHGDKIADAELAGKEIASSEGKIAFPPINQTIQAEIDYAAELPENATSLVISSITAPADKFDETFENGYETYMNNGGEQRQQERLEAYQNSLK